MQFAPYLFFDGTCEDALAFYATVFGGETVELNRYEGSPMAESMPPDQRRRIMHATFRSPDITFMASDSENDGSGPMHRVSLSLAGGDANQGRRLFDALAAGGTVTLPYAKQFWGASFGMLVDRFGVRWMINAGEHGA